MVSSLIGQKNAGSRWQPRFPAVFLGHLQVESQDMAIFREFKQITTAGATTAALTEKVWGEYVSVVIII